MDFSLPDLPPLAFVDVETTGVNPRENRITEIGVVCVDGGGTSEWSTVINPLARRREHTPAPEGITDEMRLAAPRFKDIAIDLAARLDGRLLVAHNARFDYSFLKAEFSRVGIEFHPDVLCSLMLSRKLYAQFAHHDVDSLIEHHALEAEVRHRSAARRKARLAILATHPSRGSPRGDRERNRAVKGRSAAARPSASLADRSPARKLPASTSSTAKTTRC